MERIITAAEAKQKDAQVIASGISSRVLMYNAAEGIAEAVRVRIQTGETVTAICGTGNNGGDGIAAALILHRTGCTVRIVLCGNEDRCTPDTAYYLHTAREEHIPIAGIWDSAEREILIDALFGVGLTRPIEGEAKTLIERINASGKTIVSADLPSGLHADSGRILGEAIHANCTVTMQSIKAGMLLGQGRAQLLRFVVDGHKIIDLLRKNMLLQESRNFFRNVRLILIKGRTVMLFCASDQRPIPVRRCFAQKQLSAAEQDF